jgi:hypothetical protein
VLKFSFSHLYLFAKNDLISLSLVLQIEDFEDHFNLPLSEIAYGPTFGEMVVML